MQVRDFTTSDTGLNDSTGDASSNQLVTRTSPELAAFRARVRKLIASSRSERRQAVSSVVSGLNSAARPEFCIAEFLSIITAASTPDRLDMGVDVLSQLGPLIISFSRNYLMNDIQQWGLFSDRAYEPNDDYWYILLRSVARCDSDEKSRLLVIAMCQGAHSRGVMEGVIEALGDLATAGAAALLRDIRENNADALVREMAEEALEDFEES